MPCIAGDKNNTSKLLCMRLTFKSIPKIHAAIQRAVIWQHSDPLLTGRERERERGQKWVYISTWKNMRLAPPCFPPCRDRQSYVLPLWKTKSIIQHIELCDGAKEPLFTLHQSPSTELEMGKKRKGGRKRRAKAFFETMTSTSYASRRDERN